MTAVLEPEIVVAASPREWSQRLHRHVADHGGARLRATVLHPSEALAEACHVFIADDGTSFLTPRLVEQLHHLGRLVLGVYDPADPSSEAELRAMGVDEVVPRDASTGQMMAGITALAARVGNGLDAAFAQVVAGLDGSDEAGVLDPAVERDRPSGANGTVVAVSGVSGGVGATEVALGLAAACADRGERVALVDGDDVAAALAQRLGLEPYPNLRAAVDAVERRSEQLTATLQHVASRLWLLAGLGAHGWTDVRGPDGRAVVTGLRAVVDRVIVNVGPRLEDIGSAAGPPRYGLSRQLIAGADIVVGVAPPTPTGVARLLEWAATVRDLTGALPTHVALNPTPPGLYKRGQLTGEITRSLAAVRLWYLPFDPRVQAAVWNGTLVAGGPFAKALRALAGAVMPHEPSGARTQAVARRATRGLVQGPR